MLIYKVMHNFFAYFAQAKILGALGLSLAQAR